MSDLYLCQVSIVHPEDRHFCTIADPCGIANGARSVICSKPAIAEGKVGERLCAEHVATYPEPESVEFAR